MTINCVAQPLLQMSANSPLFAGVASSNKM